MFSAQRNEGPFLLEWIAYHKVIGFTDIVIVSNDCDDGSDSLLDVLHQHGELTHIHQSVPDNTAPQKHAAQIAQTKGIFADGDWLMWLDADEFLLPSPRNPHLADLVSVADRAGAEAILMAWRFFGDGGNTTWPGRHVSDAFTLAAKRWQGRNAQVKTLFKYSNKIERLDIHRPVLRAGVTPSDFPAITSANQPANPAFYDRKRFRPYNRMGDVDRPYVLGQVAHFSIRTPDMFALKSQRGDGYYAQNNQKIIRDRRFYDRKNKNHIEERGLLVHEQDTVREMQRMQSLEGVSDALGAIAHFNFPESSPTRSEYKFPLRYWTGKPNFGDLLSPLLVSRLSHTNVNKETTANSGPYLLGVGSIIQTIDKPGAHIWGSGLLRELTPQWQKKLADNPIAQVHAVRGHLTRNELITKLDLEVPEVYGDPALLLPRVIKFSDARKRSGIAFCPHLAHQKQFQNISDPHLRLIDVRDHPIEVIRSLAHAEVVLSSSLHGLVVAQAYGIPWVWITVGGKPLDGSNFKFHDFFSTLSMDQPLPLSLPNTDQLHDAIQTAAEKAILPDLNIDLESLIAAMPGQLHQRSA
ncbi:MAG: glycosyltransferase family 2 protein [Pseudomonadota bacterium]